MVNPLLICSKPSNKKTTKRMSAAAFGITQTLAFSKEKEVTGHSEKYLGYIILRLMCLIPTFLSLAQI